MAATATVPSGPRYAPEDPTLPKPWKGLVDGKTGYLYFWNPVTNITQYERPSSSGSAPQAKSSPVPLSSSIRARDYSPDDDDKYGKNGVVGSKLVAAEARSQQSSRPQSVSNGGSSARALGSTGGGSGLSPESYRQRHEITVSGDNVPPPFTTFEETDFPSELLREVRYLLLGGANVVRCAALFAYEEGFWNHPSSWAGLLLVIIHFATQSEQKKRPPPAPACVSKQWPPAHGG